MASPDENPAAIFRTLSGGVEPDEYELDSKSWPTWRRYRAAFNNYSKFCEEIGAQAFPATVGNVRAFFRHVVERGGAVVSCDITKQVIKLVHRLRDYPPVAWDSMREFHQGVGAGMAARAGRPSRCGPRSCRPSSTASTLQAPAAPVTAPSWHSAGPGR